MQTFGLSMSSFFAAGLSILVVLTFFAGLIKVGLNKRDLRKRVELANLEAANISTDREKLVKREPDEGDLFGVRAIQAGFFGGVSQSCPNSPSVSRSSSVCSNGLTIKEKCIPRSSPLTLMPPRPSRKDSMPNRSSGSSSQHSMPNRSSGSSSQHSMPNRSSGSSSQHSMPNRSSGSSSRLSLSNRNSSSSFQHSISNRTSDTRCSDFDSLDSRTPEDLLDFKEKLSDSQQHYLPASLRINHPKENWIASPTLPEPALKSPSAITFNLEDSLTSQQESSISSDNRHKRSRSSLQNDFLSEVSVSLANLPRKVSPQAIIRDSIVTKQQVSISQPNIKRHPSDSSSIYSARISVIEPAYDQKFSASSFL